MEKVIIAAIAIMGLQARANGLTIPVADRPALTKKIQTVLEHQYQSELKDLEVDWNARCLSSEDEMDPQTAKGVCLLKVVAFMVSGEVAVVKGERGYAINTVYADMD